MDAPGSAAWLEKAYWQYVHSLGGMKISKHGAKGLALSLEHRRSLLAFPTTAMVRKRHQIGARNFEVIRARLESHAVANPDRSGVHQPGAIAQRRASLWRVYVLTRGSFAEVARNWQALTGQVLSRQAISKQIGIISAILHDEQFEEEH